MPNGEILPKKTKLQRIQTALNSDPIDLSALRMLAISPGGLLNSELRRKAWPKLLNVNVFDALVKPGNFIDHKDYQQVLLDVDRSVKRFPPTMHEGQRCSLQKQATEVILWILKEHPELHYYQGFHDICITFLLICGQKLTYRLMEKLSTHHLRDFMDPTMDKTRHILNYLIPVVWKANSCLGDFLVRSDAGTIFALSWLITWYGHVLADTRSIWRLCDFFLASHPLMPMYLAVKVVLHREKEIMKEECDMALVHHLLSRFPQDLPLEKIIEGAGELFIDFPPESIAKEATLYYHESFAISTFREFELAGYQQRPDFVLRERRIKRDQINRRVLMKKSNRSSVNGNRPRRWTVWLISSALGAAALAVTNVSFQWASEVVNYFP